MIDRRGFLGGAAAVLALAPWGPRLRAADSAAEGLPTRRIPGTDVALPVVGLGNSQAFRDGDLETTRTLLELFLARGGAYVDVSGPSRFVVAEAAAELGAREALFYGTYIESGDDAGDRREIAEVLAAQGRERLDLVLTRDLADFAARRGAFRTLTEEGLARQVGVARHRLEFHEPMIALMAAGAVDLVQVNYSMLEPEAEQRLLPMAQDLGIGVLINRPFVNGDYFRLVRGRPLPGWAADFDCHSWAQFSLKFILSHPAVTCVLTETANPKHAVDNLGGGLGRLPDEATRRRMRAVIRELA